MPKIPSKRHRKQTVSSLQTVLSPHFMQPTQKNQESVNHKMMAKKFVYQHIWVWIFNSSSYQISSRAFLLEVTKSMLCGIFWCPLLRTWVFWALLFPLVKTLETVANSYLKQSKISGGLVEFGDCKKSNNNLVRKLNWRGFWYQSKYTHKINTSP